MTVGLLGGTFDPPHVGHVALAERAFVALGLDRLLVVVVGEAPHKPVETPAEIRFRLAEAAFGNLPHVDLSRRELDRPGPSFTVDTARWAGDELDDPVFIVGADEFADFPHWRAPDEILEHVRLAVATRPGVDRARLRAVQSALAHPERVIGFDLEPVPVSSREIRELVASGEPIDGLVPPAVARLIAAEDLYRV